MTNDGARVDEAGLSHESVPSQPQHPLSARRLVLHPTLTQEGEHRLLRLLTPQSEPIPETTQVPDSAGGYVWPVDKWTRLDRFLVLGTEGGTHYIAERQLTQENALSVIQCLAEDGPRLRA